MSNEALTWAWSVQRLNPVEKLVLISLADQANKVTSQCNPGLETLKQRTGASQRGIQNAIGVLIGRGLIRRDLRVGIGATYTLLTPAVSARVTPATSATPTPAVSATVTLANGPDSDPPPRQPVPVTPAVSARDPGSECRTTLAVSATEPLSKKKDSEAYASDAEAASPPPSSRDLVWSQGVPLVRHLTGKTDAQCRSMLGRMLRDVQDDCPRLLMVLQQARDFRPIDPVAWLTAATKPKSVKAGRDERILRAAGLWDDGTTIDFDHEPRGMLQ